MGKISQKKTVVFLAAPLIIKTQFYGVFPIYYSFTWGGGNFSENSSVLDGVSFP